MAPPLLSLTETSLSIGPRPLFKDLTAHVHSGARIALVGRNGAGKSTLLRVLAGTLESDRGERTLAPRVRVAHLAQEPSFEGVATALDYLLQDTVLSAHRAEDLLAQFSVPTDADPSTLSGGEQRRLALAGLFAADADILLLDEPTNHLDLPTIAALEDRLLSSRQAMILISHDRTFLERLSTACWWLDRGRVTALDVGFADLDAAIEQALEEEKRAQAKLAKQIQAEEHWVRYGVTARRKRNQGRLRKLADLRSARAAYLRPTGSAALKADAGASSGKVVIEADGVTKAYGERTVVPPFSTRILRGDRIGIVGRNGAGKTTLLRMLTGELEPDSGSVTLGTNLVIGRYEQDRASLDPGATPWTVLCPEGGDTLEIGGAHRHVMGYLKEFLFDESQARSPVRALSGGERNRLLLARILSRPTNLLIMDEPTNDLDTDTLDVLQEMLTDYQGTLLLVSHDRDFLDRVVTATIAFEADDTLVEYAGGYSDMLAQRREAAAPAQASAPTAKNSERGFTTPAKERRQRERLVARLEKELEALSVRIDWLDAQLADADLYVSDPSGATKLANEREQLLAERERLEGDWVEAAERLEAAD